MPSLTMSLRWIDAEDARRAVALRDDERRAAAAPRSPSTSCRAPRGDRAAAAPATQRRTESAAPLRDRCARRRVDAAHAGLRGERHELARPRGRAPRRPYAPPRARRSNGPRASRRRGWRAARRRPARSTVDAGHRDELAARRLPSVIVPGLVEQQRVDVARRLDRAARHRQHVALHEPVHAGDADGREQRADRRRDQADEQGDEHDRSVCSAPA